MPVQSVTWGCSHWSCGLHFHGLLFYNSTIACGALSFHNDRCVVSVKLSQTSHCVHHWLTVSYIKFSVVHLTLCGRKWAVSQIEPSTVGSIAASWASCLPAALSQLGDYCTRQLARCNLRHTLIPKTILIISLEREEESHLQKKMEVMKRNEHV